MLSAIFPGSCLPRLEIQLPPRFQYPRLLFPFLHHFRSLRRRDHLHHHQGLSQCHYHQFPHHLRTHHLHRRRNHLCPSPFQHQFHSSRFRQLRLSQRHLFHCRHYRPRLLLDCQCRFRLLQSRRCQYRRHRRRTHPNPTSWNRRHFQVHQNPRSRRFRQHLFRRRRSLHHYPARNRVPRLRVRALVHPSRRHRRRWSACFLRPGSFAASCWDLRRSP
jgi:hypothetical protein